MSAKVDTVHFFNGSQKPFVGSSPSRSLTKSSNTTLPLPGMPFAESSTSCEKWILALTIKVFLDILHILSVLV